jgi:hypothetical protein
LSKSQRQISTKQEYQTIVEIRNQPPHNPYNALIINKTTGGPFCLFSGRYRKMPSPHFLLKKNNQQITPQ